MWGEEEGEREGFEGMERDRDSEENADTGRQWLLWPLWATGFDNFDKLNLVDFIMTLFFWDTTNKKESKQKYHIESYKT